MNWSVAIGAEESADSSSQASSSSSDANSDQPAAANRMRFRTRAVTRDEVDSVEPRRRVEPSGDGAAPLFRNEQPMGYYPTRREWETIGGYYPRADLDSPGGGESDRRTQAPSGLWPYPTARENYLFGRHPQFFDAVDRYLGLFAPDGVIAHEDENLSTGGLFQFNGNLPFLTRAFNPERAMLKLGPVYLDVLAVSGSILYSDYHGPDHFPRGQEPGWLAIASVDFRVVVQLAENLFLAATTTAYYLPFTGDVGIFVGDGAGLGLGLNFFMGWEKEVNGWWLTFTDRLGVQDRLADYSDAWSADAIDIAGHYSFGRRNEGERHLDFFDTKRLILANAAQFSLIGMIDPNWRLTADVRRTDAWDVANLDTSFDDYRGVVGASVRVDYAGQDWRFAPYASASTSVDDRFEDFINQMAVGARGRLTSQLLVQGEIGYAWAFGEDAPFTDSLTYQLGLVHEVGPYTRQSLFAGHGVTESDFAERRFGSYVSYNFDQILSRRLRAGFTAQWQDTVDVDSGDRDEGFGAGVHLSLAVTDFTRFNVTASYDRFNHGDSPDTENYLLSASLQHRILAGLYASLIYRHEQFNSLGGPGDFREDVYQLTLTQTF